ncbi:hypothetical protein KU70_05760 [Campylobacter fetus]|uniref:DUF91 domain-containing protein n=1 Tax=Campylobacter fetus TaxID=196 RepID=A0A825BFQ0_CAMFE|nr:hypothetical protein [Campylobacter fetus]KGT36450.1 hypothetical protein KU70_05760 [Campylobacter fetus]
MNRLLKIDKLIKQRTDKIITCSELNKELVFECNGILFTLIKVDDKTNILLNNQDIRCDYIITSNNTNEIALFIELKGSDISHAFRQIQTMKDRFSKEYLKVYGAIIYSGSPFRTIIQNSIQKAKKSGFKNVFVNRSSLVLKYIKNEIKK